MAPSHFDLRYWLQITRCTVRLNKIPPPYNEPLRKTGIVFLQDTQGIKLAFNVQTQWLGRQMKQLCGLWGFALKSDQDGCLFCIIPQRQLVIISISNML